ncbi:hypothetical protein DSO57_1038277 [Entomophthora muscae]|uniref:Uncharacterized protein n=1 Tax=Entomophthora muscae TaxID=34485 RepID=A0ACC2TKF3_9FUNG|nr:hypothetical protein DSO57_1038277 [Entomophthora muscae]
MTLTPQAPTPLRKVKLLEDLNLYVKCEFMNPSGSIEDRVARHILNSLDKNSFNFSDSTLIIPTSGNLGISIASLIGPRKAKLICVIPERTTSDRIQLLKALGVEIVRSAVGAHSAAAESSLAIAKRLAEGNHNAIVIEEGGFSSEYEAATAELCQELLLQCEKTPDYVVIGAETKSIYSGIARTLKSTGAGTKVVFVEPLGSSALEDVADERYRKNWMVEDLGSHFKLGIAADLIDLSFKIPDAASYSTARRLLQSEGILGGPSSGAVVAAAMRIQSTSGQVVAILNDTCRNYHNTLLSDTWLAENNLLDAELEAQIRNENISKFRGASVEDLQLPEAVSIPSTSPIGDALLLMLERDFSQLPVVNDRRKLVGFVSQGHLEHLLSTSQAYNDTPIGNVILHLQRSQRRPYHLITPDTSLNDLSKFFENFSAGFVTDEARNWCLAVVTKFDLMNFLTKRKVGVSL